VNNEFFYWTIGGWPKKAFAWLDGLFRRRLRMVLFGPVRTRRAFSSVFFFFFFVYMCVSVLSSKR
jgi:hypothetical protein